MDVLVISEEAEDSSEGKQENNKVTQPAPVMTTARSSVSFRSSSRHRVSSSQSSRLRAFFASASSRVPVAS